MPKARLLADIAETLNLYSKSEQLSNEIIANAKKQSATDQHSDMETDPSDNMRFMMFA